MIEIKHIPDKDLELEQFEKELDWLSSNKEIIDKHQGQLVAVKNKQFLCSAKNPESMIEKLSELGIDRKTVLVQYITPENQYN